MAKVIEARNPHAAWATMSVRTLVILFFYGLAVGIATYAVYLLLERFVFEPILCREGVALTRCENTASVSAGVAMVMGSLLGLVLLVRERVYRPILAIIGLLISLWGVFALVAALPVVAAVIVVGLLFAVAYMLFSWLVQPTSLTVCIVAVIIVSVLARIALG